MFVNAARVFYLIIFIIFYAAQEEQQMSHFSSAHGLDRQKYTFLIHFFYILKNKKVNVDTDDKPGREFSLSRLTTNPSTICC